MDIRNVAKKMKIVTQGEDLIICLLIGNHEQ